MDLTVRSRFLPYFFISNVLAIGCIYHAFDTRSTFLSACIFLSGGLNIIILSNWVILWSIVFGKVFQLLLFGNLRIIEEEHIYERIGFALTGNLIALGTLRNDTPLLFGGLTLIMLTLKIFHWILFDRFDALFQVNDENQLYNLKRILLNRIVIAAGVILVVDYNLILYFLNCFYRQQPSDVYVAFGFELGLLFIEIIFNIVKVAVSVTEIVYLSKYPDEEVWESKSFYMQLVEIVHAFVKAVINLLLFFIFSHPYYFSVHLVRNCWISCLSFYKKVKDFAHFLKNAKRLDNYLLNATEGDLEGDNNLCIICREDMTTEGLLPGHRLYPKKLKCNHIIHLACLKSWLEISQHCPMCRAQVFNDDSLATTNPISTAIPNFNGNLNNLQNANETEANTAATNGGLNTRNSTTNNNNSDLGNANIEHASNEIGQTFSNSDRAASDAERQYAESQSYFQDVGTSLGPAVHDDIFEIPEDALLPSDWTILPLQVTGDNKLQVYLNKDTWGDVEVKENAEYEGEEKPVKRSLGKEKLIDVVGGEVPLARGSNGNSVDEHLQVMSDKIRRLEEELQELKRGRS